MWWFSKKWRKIKICFWSYGYENVCIERIQKRGDYRVDDNIDTIKKRFKSLKEETEPTVIKLKNYGLVYEIKADQTIDKVFEIINRIKKSILPEEINEGINSIIFSSKKDSNIIQI